MQSQIPYRDLEETCQTWKLTCEWQAGWHVGTSEMGHMMRLSLAGSSAIQKSVVNVVVVVKSVKKWCRI